MLRLLSLALALMVARLQHAAAAPSSDARAPPPPCGAGMTHLDSFELGGVSWAACEDLQQPSGAIALLSSEGRTEWFAKGHEEYADPSAVEAQYYFPVQGLNKSVATKDAADILGQTILSKNFTHVSWQTVASAIPPIRMAGGVRTFVGSRGSSVDTTFSDAGEDAAGYGFPPAVSYVFNLTNQAEGGTFIVAGHGKASSYLNTSGIAEGLVGGELPIVVFYFPVLPACDPDRGGGDPGNGQQRPPVAAECTTNLPPGTTGSRYWTMVAAGTPDMQGSREQGVWFRYQQVECGTNMAPPCKLVGLPQYWDTYWWSRTPGGGDTELTGPRNASLPNATGFYATLLENRRWWRAELAAEGMMELPSLPSPKTTNGTWIHIEARHNIILSMITWNDKWGPRYGVLPGYGITMQQGFEDTFTGIAMAALEVGAEEYSRGWIDQQYRHYIRADGTINYRANELAQEARMLTILALCHSYRICDDEFVLSHYTKAKAVADMLAALRDTALHYDKDDPRYGLIAGLDEGDTFTHVYSHQGETIHWYSHAAETYRAFTDMGEVWSAIGKSSGRADVAAHGAELLTIAPQLYHDLHVSMNKTRNTTSSPGHACYNHRADGESSFYGCSFRAWPETFYSGVLTAEQTDAIYIQGAGLTTCNSGRFLSLGVPSGGNGRMFVHIPQGFPYGLLVHDMVERFLLYFFTHSAHTNTRGTFTTPESTTLDRNGYDYAYASPGTGNVPMCLKWMLCFEEPQTRTLWLGKALPRDWLVAGEAPLVAKNLTTRYGRISLSLEVGSEADYSVKANVTLPLSFATKPPVGGVRLRIRAPLEHAGKLSKVTVGGQAWSTFDASEETVDIAASKLTAELIKSGLPEIVATFGASTAVPLRPALFDAKDRIIPKPVDPPELALEGASEVSLSTRDEQAPSCPNGMDQVDAFTINATVWVACEDLQQPGGAIVLVPDTGEPEYFEKSYEPYRTNWTDDSEYYLGLTKAAVANATTDILGAKLLGENEALSWAAVERAAPPIRLPSGPRGAGCNTNRPVRTFVGSRTSRVDASTDNHGGDSNWQGWPSWQSYAIDLHNVATGEPKQTYNGSASGDGLVGSVLPAVVFYTPMIANSSLDNHTVEQPDRYWTVMQVAVQDQACDPEQNQVCNPEQNVLIRFQQVACPGPYKKPPCKLHGWPMYWDSYWFSRFPGANVSDANTQTLITGPVNATSSSHFYETLLDNKRYWDSELAAEGMMELSLPSPISTNGTWLKIQAVHSIVRSMITRQNTWEPRYGVCPGFGAPNFYGLQDVFTTTATAALEFGAMVYARGVVDYQFKHYVRPDGMVWFTAVELPATARMLTVLAKFHGYSADDALLLEHFEKAKALADWLESRRSTALQFDQQDPRYGIPVGGDDAQYDSQSTSLLMNHDEQPLHWYASAAETYRAFTDMGEVWSAIGKSSGRADVAAHGAELLTIAPQLYHDLHVSMNKTVSSSASGERCWALVAETVQQARDAETFRGFSEMLYSGALSAAQVADIYTAASGGSSCGAKRFLTLGSPGVGATTIATPTPYGFAHALLQHDMAEKFLLHYFAVSAHAYTRGTFTTPESTDIADRDVPPGHYVSAGVMIAPTYLKWMLCFEEPQTRTLWLGKALPRDWLVAGEAPLVAKNLTTRYGRISLSLEVGSEADYSVKANVTLPLSFATKPPVGGVRLRIRAPLEHAGKLSKVTVGGQAWSTFDASEETVDIAASKLTAELIKSGLPEIVATFGASTAVPLRTSMH